MAQNPHFNNYLKQKPDFMDLATDENTLKNFDFSFTIRRKYFILMIKLMQASDSDAHYTLVRSCYVILLSVTNMLLPYISGKKREDIEYNLKILKEDMEKINRLSREQCAEVLIKITEIASSGELYFENLGKGMEVVKIADGILPSSPNEKM